MRASSGAHHGHLVGHDRDVSLGGDGVAIAVLLGSGLVRLGPARELFQGVSEPVVITVISGLIFGSGMQSSGAVDALARVAAPSGLASGRAARH